MSIWGATRQQLTSENFFPAMGKFSWYTAKRTQTDDNADGTQLLREKNGEKYTTSLRVRVCEQVCEQFISVNQILKKEKTPVHVVWGHKEESLEIHIWKY